MGALTPTYADQNADHWSESAHTASAVTYYHGTTVALPPGTILQPQWTEKSRNRGDHHVHFTTDLDTAFVFAGANGDIGHVYEVEPIGDVEKWRFNEFSYRAPKARIIREVPTPKLGSTSPADRVRSALTHPMTTEQIVEATGLDLMEVLEALDEIRASIDTYGSPARGYSKLWSLASTTRPRLYHGTPHALPIGTVLVPGGPKGKSDWPGVNAMRGVWMTSDLVHARMFMGEAGEMQRYNADGHVYLVEPVGEAAQLPGGRNPRNWYAGGARIIAEVDPETGESLTKHAATPGPGPYYHGTPVELPEGTILTNDHPARNKGRTEGRVWATDRLNLARAYGGHVYEVEPLDPPQAGAGSDPERAPEDFPDPWPMWWSSGWRIIREVPASKTASSDHLGRSYEAKQYDHLMGVQANASLPRGTYWRIHPKGRPWDDPSSTQFHSQPGEGTRTGFSCFDDPWVLWAYVMRSWAGMVGDASEVVAFKGQRVGTGHDGEDLVLPTGGPTSTYTWDEFRKQLLTTPVPSSPAPAAGSWRSLLRVWDGDPYGVRSKEMLPEVERIVDEVGMKAISYADFEVDEGTVDPGDGVSPRYLPSSTEFELTMRKGDHGFYSREQAMIRAGMPRGQRFRTAEDIERYVRPLLPSGMDIAVTVGKHPCGEARGGVAKRKSTGGQVAVLQFCSDTTWEYLVLHEVAHILHRLKGGRGQAAHGFDYAGEWARLMYQQIGWTFDLGFPRSAALEVAYSDGGRYARRDHITMGEKGTIPIEVVKNMPGQMGERPGDHRNKKGEVWEEFKRDLTENGMRYGIFICVVPGEPIRIWEGNHRRDAAVELGWDEIPVEIRYFGLAEEDGTLMERYAKGGRWMDGYIDTERVEREKREREQRWGALKTAGPSSGVIPERVRADAPLNPQAPRPVVVNRMAESDIRDLPDGDEKIVRQMLKRIERGEVELERKSRYPLQDCFTADASRSLRIALFPHVDGSWQCFYVGYHDYDEAERRMARAASKVRPAINLMPLPASIFPPTLTGGEYRERTWKSWSIIDRESDQTVGVVQGYEPKGDGPFTIAWINITPEWKRKGYASQAVAFLVDRYGDADYDSLTDDGEKFWPKRGAMETPCQTSGAEFSTHISEDGIAARVDLPFDLDLTEAEAETLEANVHNALELVLAPYFRTASVSEAIETFTSEPHDTLYPPVWGEDNLMRPEVAQRLREVALEALGAKPTAARYLRFWVEGSGASFNWNEGGDLDIQVWVANETPIGTTVAIREGFEKLRGKTLEDFGLEGKMGVQFFAKAGDGTDEENLASNAYALYDMDTARWLTFPVPQTPAMFRERFERVRMAAEVWADQADEAMSGYERALGWLSYAAATDQDTAAASAALARAKADVVRLYETLATARSRAYRPGGRGIEDPRDTIVKVLEVMGVWPRLHDLAMSIGTIGATAASEITYTHDDGSWPIVIALHEDQVVGQLSLDPQGDHWDVVNVSVEPEYRGRGIATRLYEHALEHLTKGKPFRHRGDNMSDDAKGLFPVLERIQPGKHIYAAKGEAWGPDDIVTTIDGYDYLLIPERKKVIAYPQGEDIRSAGILQITPSFGPLVNGRSTYKIRHVSVVPEHQGKGVASTMLRLAREHWGTVLHSDDLTPEGRAWSEKVGRVAFLREGDERPFKEYLLRYEQADFGERKPRHIITAWLGSEKVGELNWYGTTGTVHNIDVEQEHSRRGIATAMWEWSQEARPRAKHSKDRTDMGDAWARSVGGTLPRRSRASNSGVEIEVRSESSRNEAIARIDGEVVGRLAIWGIGTRWFVDRVFVAPAHRRKGIATEMVRTLEAIVGKGSINPGDDVTDAGAAWSNAAIPDPDGREWVSTWGSEPDWTSWLKQAAVSEYGGGHQPSEGPPAYDLLDQSGDFSLPDDIYDKPQWYTGFTEPEYLSETMRALRAVRGKPEAKVRIYRALPPGLTSIETGNWISLSLAYAKGHAMQSDDPDEDWPVISAEVPAKYVRHAGDDLMEYGYWGPPIRATKVAAIDPSRKGMCYVLAGQRVSGSKGDGAKLVHGSIQGDGQPRIGHAWVIQPDGNVWDPVLDEVFPPFVYEHFFNTEVDDTYEQDEVWAITVNTGHWGPWEQNERTSQKHLSARITDLSPAEFSSKRWVYHGTRSASDLAKLLTEGVRISNVPMNLNRRRFQSGEEGIFFQPGAGVGMGLYVGDFWNAQQFGNRVVAIEVTDGDLGLPPESADYADHFDDPIGKALKDANGAMIVRDIPASRVYLVADGFTHYERDPMEMARKYASASCRYQHPKKIEMAELLLEQAKDQPKESRREHMRSIANGALRNIRHQMATCPDCSDAPYMIASLQATAGVVPPDQVELRGWYHGTNADLPPGTILTDDHEQVHDTERTGKVWISDNAWQASKYGSRTYQVIPKGEVRFPRPGHPEFWCHSAEVWREVDKQTILDHARAELYRKHLGQEAADRFEDLMGLNSEAAARIRPLPMGKGIFYRLQGERPFDPMDATSTPLVSRDDAERMFGKEHADRWFDTKQGYSAFANPEHVRQYVEEMGWDEGKVVAFRGTIIGSGLDDEPLVQPEGGPIETISWDDFVTRIEITPGAVAYPDWASNADGGGRDYEIPGQGPRFFTIGVGMRPLETAGAAS